MSTEIRRTSLLPIWVLALAIAASLARPSSAQALWGGAVVGASPAQAARLAPALRTAFKPLRLSSGEIEGLQGGARSIAGVPLTAHLMFKDGALSSVQLRTQAFRPSESARNLSRARAIADVYTRAYGAPYDCGDQSASDVAYFRCKWLRGEVSIQLTYTDVAGQSPLFYVSMRKATNPDFDF